MPRLLEQDLLLLCEEMSIDTSDLLSKVSSLRDKNHIAQIEEAIQISCQHIRDNASKEESTTYFSSINELEGEAELVIDSLRMAFYRYLDGGIHDLYVHQENEQWFPKIILKEVIQPNDIDTLEKEFVIYRGCHRAEHDNKNYGQSWTTSLSTAEEFAFELYSSQDWFNINDRVVLQATCQRDNVLFSNQTDEGEYEVAILTNCLTDVTLFH